MKTILIKNGYVVDPASKFEGIADLYLENGVICKVSPDLDIIADRVLDAAGLTVLPGLVDLHVHLRDPGQTHKEDVGTAGAAAAHGGVTSLLAMPNTKPPMDSVDRVSYVVNKAQSQSPVHIYQTAALTKEMKGEDLVDFDALCAYGVKAFSEDGKSVMNGGLMRKALKEAAAHGTLVCEHAEDSTMVEGGVMNEDENARRLGLPGISNSVEDVIVARDVVLAKETGAKLHFCHCSTAGSVRLIAMAKETGAHVTAEVCPHHFILTSDDIPGDDANYKMNPPLRSKADAEALKKGLQDGTIDCISTDHAPHSADEKSGGFRKAPFGIVGLETSAALTYTELVKGGTLTLMQMAEKMCLNPARILGIDAGTLTVGAPADIAVFDFEHPYRIDPETFLSKGKNTPFAGREVYGAVKYTLTDGDLVWEGGND
jgi:dihydroorotase